MKLLSKKFTLITTLLFWFLSSATHAQFFSNKTEPLLPGEEAFQVIANVDGDTLNISWVIADGYYMYREQFRVESTTPTVQLGELAFTPGTIENDPEFGEVEVYFHSANISAPLSGQSGQVDLVIKGQGCNKPVGVCYPPLTHNVSVTYSNGSSSKPTNTGSINEAAKNTTQAAGQTAPDTSKSFWTYVLFSLAAGLALSFTPCVLPMIPILLGIIAGQNNPSRLQSGWLASCYVLGTMTTYAIAGWIAGASGIQLQAYTQNPWFIGPVCVILIGLALSLFGLFKIQLPSSIQTKLNTTDVTTRSAAITSYILGLISALVIGACVSPILFINLGVAISQNDPVLGASIMSAMALGMGTLLILVGFGAGWLLPKAGAWMNHVLVTFGFMVLAVAIYLSSNLNIVPTLFLWAGLFIFSGFYLFKISDEVSSILISSLIKAIALIILLWGCLSLIGGFAGDDNNVLKPLTGVTVQNTATGNSVNTGAALSFKKVTSLKEAQVLLNQAKASNKPVMVDFYAKWCIDCKRMHRTTYKNSSVIQSLNGWDIIEVDVTETSKKSEEVKQYFDVFGPPATLFFKADGSEHKSLRQYGYMNKDVFLTIINKARG